MAMPIGRSAWEARADMLREMLRASKEQTQKIEGLYWEAAKEAVTNGSVTYKLLVLSREEGLYKKWAHACGMEVEPMEEQNDPKESESSGQTYHDVPEGVSGIPDSGEGEVLSDEGAEPGPGSVREGLDGQS